MVATSSSARRLGRGKDVAEKSTEAKLKRLQNAKEKYGATSSNVIGSREDESNDGSVIAERIVPSLSSSETTTEESRESRTDGVTVQNTESGCSESQAETNESSSCDSERKRPELRVDPWAPFNFKNWGDAVKVAVGCGNEQALESCNDTESKDDELEEMQSKVSEMQSLIGSPDRFVVAPTPTPHRSPQTPNSNDLFFPDPRNSLENMYNQARIALSREKYDKFIQIVREYPEVLSYIPVMLEEQCTIMHAFASQSPAPPENIILQIISQDPAAMAISDADGNTPLHFAARAVNESNIAAFDIFLKFQKQSALKPNSQGNLPIHLAAAAGTNGAEEAVRALFDISKNVITAKNGKGQTALHLACSRGSKNTACLRQILAFHKQRKVSINALDNEGNSPLHLAIKNDAPPTAISSFQDEAGETFLSAYLTRDHNGDLPLHCALKQQPVSARVVKLLIQAVPFAGRCENSKGEMPVQLATENATSDIVADLLRLDMPIELGNKGNVIEREHGHSWWHVAIECRDRFTDAIDQVLSPASLLEIITLARSKGPDEESTINAARCLPELAKMFRAKLRILNRYYLCTESAPYVDERMQVFQATDKRASSYDEEDPTSKKRGKQRVTLRCYSLQKDFAAEIDIRRRYDMLSSNFIEEIKSVHQGKEICSKSKVMYCISFAKPTFTLEDVLERFSVEEFIKNDREKSLDQLCSIHELLNSLCQALKHLHQNGLVLGNLDPRRIANFRGTWKLLEIGDATPIGSAMSGPFRRYAPPESVIDTELKHLLRKKKYSQQEATSLRIDNTKSSASSGKKGDQSGRLFPIREDGNEVPDIGEIVTSKKKGRKKNIFGRKSSDGDNDDCSVISALSANTMSSTGTRKKRQGVLLFKMRDLGLGDEGCDGNEQCMDHVPEKGSAAGPPQAASERIITAQEEEIKRLRKALADKQRELHGYKQAEKQSKRAMRENKQNENTVRFAPEICIASPSWDAFSFGELMARLFLVNSSALPVMEDADEMVKNRLCYFDESDVDTISAEVESVAGFLAADLVTRLLDPSPSRLSSMKKILSHKYFHEDVKVGTGTTKAKDRAVGRRSRGGKGAGKGEFENDDVSVITSMWADNITISS